MINSGALDIIANKITALEDEVRNYDAANEAKGIEIYSTISAIIFQLDLFEIRNMRLEEVRSLKAKCESLREQVIIFKDKYMEQFLSIEGQVKEDPNVLDLLDPSFNPFLGNDEELDIFTVSNKEESVSIDNPFNNINEVQETLPRMEEQSISQVEETAPVVEESQANNPFAGFYVNSEPSVEGNDLQAEMMNMDDVPVSMESSQANNLQQGGMAKENVKVVSLTKPRVTYGRAA